MNSANSERRRTGLILAVALAALPVATPVVCVAAATHEALVLNLPPATLKGTPDELPEGPNIEPYSDQPPPVFLVPKGVKNVAAGKPVTSSVKPFTGELAQITDGRKEAFDYDSVEMKKGTQWVQVDLGEPCAIYAVVMWHDHRYIQVMHDVIVQVSNDPQFQENVTTLFNNDADNSSGLGVGADREYFETRYGKVVDGRGIRGQFVRCYTKGGTLSALNCWQEIEVYALPAALGFEVAVAPPTARTVIVTPPVVVGASEPGQATAIAAVVQTEPTPKRGQTVPVQINVEPAPPVQAIVETPAPAPTAAVPTTPAAGSGLNWTAILIGGLAFLGAAFGAFFAFSRFSHAAPSAKSK